MHSRSVLVHCPSCLGAQAAVLNAEVRCRDGVFATWARERSHAIDQFDGVMSHSFKCSPSSRRGSEPKLPFDPCQHYFPDTSGRVVTQRMSLEVTTISLAGGAHQSSKRSELTYAPIALIAGLLMNREVTKTLVHYEKRISPFGSKTLGTMLPPTRTRVRLVIRHDQDNALFLRRHLPIKDSSEVFLCLCHAAWVHFLSLSLSPSALCRTGGELAYPNFPLFN